MTGAWRSERPTRGKCRPVDLSLVLASAVLAPGAARSQQAAPASPPSVAASRTADGRHAGPLVIDGVNVVDVRTGRIRPSQRVVIVASRIQAVGDARRVRRPRGAQVLDARGRYVIPGLWDMHVHAVETGSRYIPYMPFVVHGITGVREMGTPVPLDSIHAWRRAVAAGEEVGPRIVASGPYLEADSTNGKMAAVVKTAADARRVVDSLKGAGADFVKVHFQRNNSVTPEVFFAILAEARKVGIPVVGHQAQGISMADAADSGQRTFEHVWFIETPCWKSDPAGERECAAELARLARNKVWVTPNLARMDKQLPREPGWEASYVPTVNHELIQDGLWLVRKLHRAGVGVLAASDIFTVPGPPPYDLVHHELAALVEAGLTPLEALQAATLNPAEYLEATDSLGTVARGKLADLVLLEANPLADIKNTSKVHAVIANGRYLGRATLDSVAGEFKRKRRAPAGGAP